MWLLLNQSREPKKSCTSIGKTRITLSIYLSISREGAIQRVVRRELQFSKQINSLLCSGMNNTGVMLSFVLYIKALLPASTGFHLLKRRGKWSHYLHSMKYHMVTHGHPARGGLYPSLCAQFKSKIRSLHYIGLASGKEGQDANRAVSRKKL